ncbi:ATP-binding cassette domain-containing protein, partial [Staphylococcus epidermidis]
MFKYSNEKGNDFSIKHVTLDINEHEHIALVGPSGAGKTTFAKLISQSLKPTEGHVSYKYDQMQIGILSQRPY